MKIKQRIVGILVLVALAIVIIPIFFSKSPQQEETINANLSQQISNAPPASDKVSNSLAIPSDKTTGSVSTPIGNIATSTTKANSQPSKIISKPDNLPTDKTISSLSIPAKPVPTSKPTENKITDTSETVSVNHISHVDSASPESGSRPEEGRKQKPANTGKIIKPLQKTQSHGGTSTFTTKHQKSQIAVAKIWTVQLGSFSDKVNAEKLIKQLKAKHFDVYSRTFKTKQGRSFRVYVGHAATKQQAEALLKRIEQVAHVKGITVKYNSL